MNGGESTERLYCPKSHLKFSLCLALVPSENIGCILSNVTPRFTPAKVPMLVHSEGDDGALVLRAFMIS